MRPLEPSDLSEEQGLFRIKQLLDSELEQSRLDQLWSRRLVMLFGALIAFYLAFLVFYIGLRG